MIEMWSDEFALPDPADNQGLWIWDWLHCPRPMTPLAVEMWRRWNRAGLGWDLRVVNGYGYIGVTSGAPPRDPPPTHQAPREYWELDLLPRVKEIVERVRSRDYARLATDELAALVPALLDESAAAFAPTMVSERSISGVNMRLVDFCAERWGEDGELRAMAMLGGYENAAARSGEWLLDLARLASHHRDLSGGLRARMFEDLAAAEGGVEFLAAFNAYLAEFGRGLQSWCDLHVPTWAEKPAEPLGLIARCLSDPESLAREGHASAKERREEAIARAEADLAGSPDLDQFRSLLEAARDYVPVIEDRALWQLNAAGMLRPPLLELGRRLVAAGAIDQANDIFFLDCGEIAQASTGSADMTVTVASRKADLSRWSKLSAPPTLGLPVTVEMMAAARPEVRRLFGFRPAGATPAGSVTGIGASRGVVRGRARVALDLADADSLNHGDVLVCQFTTPAWTPLFSLAAAVVTNAGGVLSHAAIEAREYGIAAVVGTRDGTRRIPDGALVTVDGTTGIVTIHG